ncbi:MAG: hypothetical protein RLZZ337_1145 [Bacteroidota bacterium]
MVSLTVNFAFGQIAGTWKLAPQAQALAVGPAKGDFSWWSNSAGDLTTRACLFDDQYVFNADGSFQNVLGSETWIEPWQGKTPEGCDAPVAPHDGSAIASWSYDASAQTITLTGKGAFLGLAKVTDGGEITDPNNAPASITYPVELSSDGKTMTIDIDFGGGFWHFVFAKEVEKVEADVRGKWQLAPIEKALAVGPSKGDFSWWSNNAADLTTRACLFDDKYIFNADGSFENELGSETWVEPWQGNTPEGCASPVAPHDGSAIASWSFDKSAGTVTLTGKGAFLGLAKVTDGGEITNPNDAPASVTYPVVFSDDSDTMTIDIDFGGGFWHFVLLKVEGVSTGNVKAFDANLFKVYPNPASTEITINSTDNLTKVSIYDVTGKEVYTSSDVSTNQKVDVSSFTRGMYTVEVITDNKKSVKKLIIN